MPLQHGLPAALAARGLTVELVPGWESRGSSSFNPAGAVAHWTAGPRTGDRPSLRICTDGREDLPGPLCSVFLTRGGVAIVVAAGRPNHAGPGGYRGLVGNSSVFGTEAENSGNGEWTDAQRYAYPRINAAFCDLGGFGADMVCGHHEWTPRKPDPRDYTMDRMRAETAAHLANPTTGEIDMTPDQLVSVLRSEGISGAGQYAQQLDPKELQQLAQTVADVLRTEGVSGAGDMGRTTAALVPAIVDAQDNPFDTPEEVAQLAAKLAVAMLAVVDETAPTPAPTPTPDPPVN